jgi:toxin ParE1/3/4
VNARVIIEPAADQDLRDQFDYIAQDSLDAALRFLDAASSTFEELVRMPGMGVPQQFTNPRLASIRRWPIRDFERYLIFYRETEDGIEVLRVLHSARDIQRILGD